jgi:solute carrier family 50 protein (sugar transporter)
MSLLGIIFRGTLSILTPILFFLMQVTYVITMNNIVESYNREKYSIIPFLTLMINCFYWTLYGVATDEMSVYISNFVGFLIGLAGTVIYHQYSIFPPYIFFYIMTFFFFFIGILIDSLKWINVLGIMAMIFAIFLYGAPLVTIFTVIQENNTESLSFPIALSSWVSSITWTLYGFYVVNDTWVVIPSLIGITLTSIQLFLFFAYGLPPSYQNTPIATTLHHIYRLVITKLVRLT